ncbi:MAG: hypothetical protein WC595_00885 [Candidatus Nanoarchaeia archaeon]
MKDLFENKSEEFKKLNKESIRICNEIENVLQGMGLVAMILIINSLSLCLKLPKTVRQRNSTLLIALRGCAKSTLIVDILGESNPNFFQRLDTKTFESQLVKKPKEYFQNKVLAHDDLITLLAGLSIKQRQQLVNFFVQILNGGRYSREGVELKDVKCVVAFGIAKENYSKHKTEFFEATLLDRIAIYEKVVNRDDKLRILEYRDNQLNSKQALPKIKLPFTKTEKTIKLNLSEEDKEEIRRLAIDLDDYGIMSFARAQDFIKVFLMSNALLNKREETNCFDLEFYKMLHPFHLEACGELKNWDIIRKFRVQNPSIPVKEIIQKTGINEKSVYRILKRLKERGEIG